MKDLCITRVKHVLQASGFQVLENAHELDLIAESPRAIVGVEYTEDFKHLHSSFDNVQAAYISGVFHRVPQEKQWDIYLVLLVPSIPRDEESTRQLDRILTDTAYCRKLVLEVSGVTSSKEWQRVLAPLLPVPVAQDIHNVDVLSKLADLLRKRQVAPEIVGILATSGESLRTSLSSLIQLRLGESHAD